MYPFCSLLFMALLVPATWGVFRQPGSQETFASAVAPWIGIGNPAVAISGGFWPGASPALVIGGVKGVPTAGNQISVRNAAPRAAPEFKLWEDDFSGDWTSRWDTNYLQIQGASTFQHEGETWLRVVYPKGEYGRGFHMVTNTPPQDRAYLEYKLRFGDDFEWVKGGKLPGLWGGKSGGFYGSGGPDGTDGFLVRFMWRVDGKGSAYVYHPDQPGRYGEDFRLDNFWFKKGVEQTLGLEVVLNTPGDHDGIIRAWLDGVLVVEETGMRFRDIPNMHIDGIKFDTFFGGNTGDWAPVKTETIEFGDFKIYLTPAVREGADHAGSAHHYMNMNLLDSAK